MALLIQLAGLIAIFFAFKIGGTAMSLATQGVSKLGRLGAGKAGGKGGQQGSGLLGKFRQKTHQTKGEYAAGTRGGRIRQAIVAPKASYGRSNLPGSGRLASKTAAQATADFERSTAEWGKQLDQEGHSPSDMKPAAKLDLTSTRSFNKSVDGLDVDTKEERERIRNAFAHHAGQSDSKIRQAAIAKAAASTGDIDDAGMQQLQDIFEGNKTLQNQAMGSVAKAAGDAGALGMEAKYSPKYEKARTQDPSGYTAIEQALKGKDAKSLASIKKKNLVSDEGDPTQFGQQVGEAIAKNPDLQKAFGAALSPAMGMSGENREAYKQVMGDDLYERVSSGNTPPSGGGPSGPQGPSGPSGPSGQQGPQGSPGGGASGPSLPNEHQRSSGLYVPGENPPTQPPTSPGNDQNDENNPNNS